MRVYVTQGLEEHFRKDKSDLHRRMFLLAVYREEYSAYEDLGAMLSALLTTRQDPDVPLLHKLISYAPGEVELRKLMKRFGISTSAELHDKSGFEELIPRNWFERFPRMNLRKALRTAADFFFVDCLKNQKTDGGCAFNKLKHGLMVVPNARRYIPAYPDIPAALFKTDRKRPEATANPVSLFAIPMSDDHLEERLRGIHFVQTSLRLISALRAITLHPETVSRRGFDEPLDLIRAPHLTDVHSFLEQVTKRDGSAS